MAKKPDQVQSIESLIGSAVSVPDGKGGTMLVPTGQTENRVANQILAAQMRHYIQETLAKYRDGDRMLTPAELRQLAEAAKIVAQFSGEVYANSEHAIEPPSMKTAQPTERVPDTIDFNDLTKKP